MDKARKDASNARPAAKRQRRSSQGDVLPAPAQAGSSGANTTRQQQQQQQQQQQRPGASLSRTPSQQPTVRNANAPAPSGTDAGTTRPPLNKRRSTDESMMRRRPLGGAPNDGSPHPDDRPPRGEREPSSTGPLRSSHAQNPADRDNRPNHNGPGLSRNNTPRGTMTDSPVEMRSAGGPSRNGTDPQSRNGPPPGPGHANGPSGAAAAARERPVHSRQMTASTTTPSSTMHNSGDDIDNEREERRPRRRSWSQSRPHDIEMGLVSGLPHPAPLTGIPRPPPPTVQTANLRNSLRRDTIIDSPDVQRSSQSYDDEKELRSNGIKDNIEKLLHEVKSTKDKCSKKALKTVWALNLAVGLQVTLGALTTGFAAVIKGNKISLIIALIGGVSTLCASYLARMRGSSEPEKSLAMKKELTALKLDLEHFQRRVEELSPMEDHIEQRVRRRLNEYQQRYFDIRNAGFGGPAAAAITSSEHMEHDGRYSSLPYSAGAADYHHRMGYGHPSDGAGYRDRSFI